jgi:hypothetical protein
LKYEEPLYQYLGQLKNKILGFEGDRFDREKSFITKILDDFETSEEEDIHLE